MQRFKILLLTLLAAGGALAQADLPAWRFARDAEGWTAPLTGAVSTQAGNLRFRYDAVVGQIPMLACTDFSPPRKARSLNLEVLANQGQDLAVFLNETDGSSYVYLAKPAQGKWSNLRLALSAFRLDLDADKAEARTDENGKLDPDQIVRILLVDPRGILAQAQGRSPGELLAGGAELRFKRVAFLATP